MKSLPKWHKKNIIDPLLKRQHGLKQQTWQKLKKIFMVLIFDNKTILTCYIYLQNNLLVKYFYYISWKFLITLCVGITFRNDFLLHFAHLVPLHFVKILYYIMRTYYISQQFFITSSVGITFRNDFLLRFVQELHFATIFITLCVGITFRNNFVLRCA